MKIKTAFQIATCLFILAFLPSEARETWFQSNPASLFGLSVINEDVDGWLAVAKNTSQSEATIEGKGHFELYSIDLETGEMHVSPQTNLIYPQTLAIIKSPMPIEKRTKASLAISDRQPASPSELTILTHADQSFNFVWLVVLMGLSVFLTYVIIDFAHVFDAEGNSAKLEGVQS